MFESKREKLIERGNVYENPLKDGFLPRFNGRGFSDQVDVPQALHDIVMTELLNEAKNKYGEHFSDIAFKGIEEDLLITIFTK